MRRRAGVGGRRAARVTKAVVAGLAAAVVATMVSGAVASAASPGGTPPADPNAQGHAYRHGVVPHRGAANRSPQPSSSAPNASDLLFGGGIDGVGVTTGPPKVYLVFWGSQWGTQSVDNLGYYEYSGDPSSMAPDIEAFFAGLGSNGELWSGVMTQYCEGVAVGSWSCPASASHVGYPMGDPGQPGALGGVWEDAGAPAPSAATANQLAQEAVKAAGVFGNTTSTSNRDAQYFIVSPTGTNPDGFNTRSGQFCAWHDYTGDSTMDGGGAVSSPYGPLAFTNMPYVTDAGLNCGEYFVSGYLDGVTIVGGHEYAETATDQFPAGGWVNSSGYENGDLCAWISSGQGAATDLSLSTGTFAVQSTWANDFNGGAGGCETSHSIVTNGNTVTVTNPGNQSSTLNGTITPVTVQASDSNASQTLTFSATGLPTGLSISSTGQISGTPTQDVYDASVTVTATDGTGAHGSTIFLWTVTPSGGNKVTVTNPGGQSSTAGKAITALQVQASDDQQNETLAFSATGLPPGLTISASGRISGTPSSAGTFNTTVTATDQLHYQGSASFTWTVSPAPNTVTVTNPGNQTTRVGSSVTLQIHATDSASGQTLTYKASPLPPGLSINQSTGLVSGKPTTAGQWTVVVTVTDGTGASGTTQFTWTVRKR